MERLMINTFITSTCNIVSSFTWFNNTNESNKMPVYDRSLYMAEKCIQQVRGAWQLSKKGICQNGCLPKWPQISNTTTALDWTW